MFLFFSRRVFSLHLLEQNLDPLTVPRFLTHGPPHLSHLKHEISCAYFFASFARPRLFMPSM